MAESNQRNDVGKAMTFIKNESLEIPTVLPLKLPDLCSFPIPCVVGKVEIERALCDLGANISLMPYCLFHRLHLGPLQPTPFSLQLVNGSKTKPLAKLEDVLVKRGDIWELEDFIISNMTKIDDAQIILGRPFLATSDCNIDVKKGRITFEVEGCHAMLCFIDKRVVYPNSSQSNAFPPSPEFNMEDILNWQDTPDFDWISIEDPDQGYVKMELAAPRLPNIPKVETYASHKAPMSDYCWFA